MVWFKGLQIRAWRVLLFVAAIFFRISSALRLLAQFRIAHLTFETRPDDIFIATFPKSGTTLMQMIVYQLTTDGRMDFPHINKVCPWIENAFGKNNSASLKRLASPRCFKTHLTADKLPIETGRYIYILRDVRDVVVSAYHHNRLLGVDATLDQMAERFLKTSSGPGQPSWASWLAFLESWWPHRDRPNVLFVSYEKMVTDLEGTIREVASFLGLDSYEENMPRILERCSFQFMKQHQDKFDPRFQSALPDTQGFIRQGKAGSGSQLDPQHQQILEKRLSELAQKLGCARGEPYHELVAALEEGHSKKPSRQKLDTVS
jgi:hypothetical protein